MAKGPVRNWVQVNVRMPADLRDRIKAAAHAQEISLNAHVINVLWDRHPDPDEKFSDQVFRALGKEMSGDRLTENEQKALDWFNEVSSRRPLPDDASDPPAPRGSE